MLKYFKKIDFFGTNFKWRVHTKYLFKSYFGAIVSLILVSLFMFKFSIFIQKTLNYGYARNTISYQFNEKSQQINFSELSFIIYSDLPSTLETIQNKTGIDYFENGKFNLSDYLAIYSDSAEKSQSDSYSLIKAEKDDCSNPKFNLNNNNTEEIIPYFICISISPNQSILKLNDSNSHSNEEELFTSKMRSRIRNLFFITLQFKKRLIKFLNETKATVNNYIIYTNNIVNPKNFTYDRIMSQISYSMSYKYYSESSIILRKSSVVQKVELDFSDLDFQKEEKFYFEEYSFQNIKTERESIILEDDTESYDFSDMIFFNYDIYDQVNEVCFLKLDDILAVVGGFLQITIFIAGITSGLYNEHSLNRYVQKYCLNKANIFENSLDLIKNNIRKQINFINFFEKNDYSRNIYSFQSEKLYRGNKAYYTNADKSCKKFNNDSTLIFNDDTNKNLQNYHSAKKEKKFYLDLNDNFNIINENKTKLYSNVFELNSKNNKLDISSNLSDRLNAEKNSNTNINNLSYDISSKFDRNKSDQGGRIKYEIKMNHLHQKDYASDLTNHKNRSDREISFCQIKYDKVDRNLNKSKNHYIKTFKRAQTKKNIKSDLLKTLDCVLVKKKKVKNITYQNHIDYNGLMSIDKYLKLLSGFEAFKSFFFNKINKFNFDSLADLYIFSGNFDFFRDIKNNPIDMNENLSEPDKKQKQLYQKFTCFLNKL